MHGGAGDAAGLGGVPDTPVRAVGRFAGERALEQGSNLVIVDAAGAARTQLVIESGQAVLDEALPPLTDGGIGPAQTAGDLGVALPRRRSEHQFGTCYQGMRQSTGAGKTAKLSMLVCTQSQSGLGASCDHARSLSQPCYL